MLEGEVTPVLKTLRKNGIDVVAIHHHLTEEKPMVSTGVRVSAKRQEAPLVLSPEQVKLGLTKLGFRDQLLVFLDGALGTRRGELGALRWSDCNFDSMSFSVLHSYYWRRGGHLKSTKTEASAKVLPMHPALKDALLEWKLQNEYNRPGISFSHLIATKGTNRWTLPQSSSGRFSRPLRQSASAV